MLGRYLFKSMATGVALVFVTMNLGAQMHVDASGQVGIGTVVPSRILHVQDVDKAMLLVENTSAGAAKLNLRNANGEWIFNARNTALRITSGAPDPELLLQTGTGDLTILGQLTTSGTTCNGGCDLVFAPGTQIESIEEHAAEMWANSYLPAVGPTKENAPFNLTEKTGGMLNELEKAHIYIERLHKRLAQLEASHAQMQSVQQQQQSDFEQIKAMLVSLQMQTQSKSVLAHME